MIAEHERIVLTSPLPEESLEAGDVGTVVFVHNNGEAYEVELFTLSSITAAVTTVRAAQLRPIGYRDLVHARPFAVLA